MEKKITQNISYIGVDDKDLDLFESQYPLAHGVSYNSYLIEDEKLVVMDTVDKRKTKQWLDNLEKALQGRKVDYLVISHLEPDHSANIQLLAEKYPDMQLIVNHKTASMLPQFFSLDMSKRERIVGEGDTISIGKHVLQFFMAPMVHWPEVMVTYEQTEKILFSADGFGKFGALDTKENWEEEARRYYFNIVGKYGIQVQNLLKKVAILNVQIICPLHGPILKENLSYYIDKYDKWSRYEAEKDGVVIAYNSIYGNTRKVVEELENILKEQGAKEVVVRDLARSDMAEVVAQAFYYDKLILASTTYDAGLFPYTETFLRRLKHKNYQKRKIGLIENGSWAPMAVKCMKEILEEMRNLQIVEPVITIKTSMKEQDREQIINLAKAILH